MITLVVFEQIIAIKVDSILLDDKALGHSLVDRKSLNVQPAVTVMFNQLTIKLGCVQLSSYLTKELPNS